MEESISNEAVSRTAFTVNDIDFEHVGRSMNTSRSLLSDTDSLPSKDESFIEKNDNGPKTRRAWRRTVDAIRLKIPTVESVWKIFFLFWVIQSFTVIAQQASEIKVLHEKMEATLQACQAMEVPDCNFGKLMEQKALDAGSWMEKTLGQVGNIPALLQELNPRLTLMFDQQNTGKLS